MKRIASITEVPQRAAILTCSALVWVSCVTMDIQAQNFSRSDNVYSSKINLPGDVRRVVVLPVAIDSKQDLEEGSDALTPILIEELIKTKKFEVVRVSPEVLKRRTGRTDWAIDAMLPADFFNTLSNAVGCDAVLFPELTVFHAYAPIAIGWRFRLVDIRNTEILWAADECFDASDPVVAESAKHFDQHERQLGWSYDPWTLLHSPRRFGRYSVATLFNLLPQREEEKH